jgi:hypothetical protein
LSSYWRGPIVLLWLSLIPLDAGAHADQKIDALAPPDVQVALAKEAAPPEVSGRATIMVLTKHGYEVAAAGSNGFTCLVLHEGPDTLEPTCYDAEGSRTLLKADLFAERLRARGLSEADVRQQIDDGFTAGTFKAPQKPGIVYMLSPRNRVYDADTGTVIAVAGHLMFYAPYATQETIGAGKGAPHVVNPGKPYTVLIVSPR